MLRSDIEKKFLKAVKIDNDNNPKKKEIMAWCNYYWKIFEEMPERTIDFIAKKLAENDSWDENKIKKKELDGKIVLPGKTTEENPLTVFVRYEIACCSCNETYIKDIFEELPSERNKSLTLEDIKSRNKNHLMIFWSHYINKDKLGNDEDFGEKRSYTDGFQYAIKDKNIGAMDFFWKKIKDDSSITNDEKEEICMQPALYRGMNTGSNADMIKFSLAHIGRDKYRNLLKKDFDEKGYYSILGKLRLEYCFEEVKELFECLEPGSESAKPGELSFEDYETSISSILNRIANTHDVDSIDSGGRLLDFIWHRPGFKDHREYFLKETSKKHSSIRQSLVDLFRKGQIVEVVSKILNSFDPEQKKAIESFDPINIEILKQVMVSTAEKDTVPTLGTEPISSSATLLTDKGAGDTAQYRDKPF